MKFAFLITVILSFNVHAQSYSSYKKDYNQAHKIVDLKSLSGWFSGRCFTFKDQKKLKSGISVFIPVVSEAPLLSFKFQIPAASIGKGAPDYYDQYDSETIDILKEVIFEENNKPSFYENENIVSYLYYDNKDYPVLKAFLKQSNSDIIVKAINADSQDEDKEVPHFFCKYSKKVAPWK